MSAPVPRHGRDIDGWIAARCAFGLDGCTDLACVCTCHDVRVGPFAAQGFGCPKCGSILNAEAAECDGGWHAANRTTPTVPTPHPGRDRDLNATPLAAPTGPEPEEREAGDPIVLRMRPVEEAARYLLDRAESPVTAIAVRIIAEELIAEVTDLRVQVRLAAADVARLEGERDEARAAAAEARAQARRMRQLTDGLLTQLVAQGPVVEAAVAALALHGPRPGWEREWKDPAEALREGWPMCAGCDLPNIGQRAIGDCQTRKALAAVDQMGARTAATADGPMLPDVLTARIGAERQVATDG